MGEYTTKTEDGKWMSIDGKIYTTRSGAYKRSKKVKSDYVEINNPQSENDGESIEDNENSDVNETDDDTPIWSKQDFVIDIDSNIHQEQVPAILKRIKPSAASKGGKKTKKDLEMERSTNVALTKIVYKSADVGLTKYKRIMMEDPNSEAITHSEEDYEWISNIAVDAMEYNGFNLGSVIGANQIFVISNVGWFGVPIYKINKESEKSPFKGKLGGSFGRLLEKIPIIGKRIRNKKSLPKEVVKNG